MGPRRGPAEVSEARWQDRFIPIAPASPLPLRELKRRGPKGRRPDDQALAQVNNDIWVVTVPMIGGEAPQITVGESSQFPARRLTEIGGQFPAWSSDGTRVHWSVGNAHFVYDLTRDYYQYQLVLFGMIIVLTVLYMPRGIGGLIDRYLATRRFVAIRKARANAA